MILSLLFAGAAALAPTSGEAALQPNAQHDTPPTARLLHENENALQATATRLPPCESLPPASRAVFSMLLDTLGDSELQNITRMVAVLGRSLQVHAPDVPRYLMMPASMRVHHVAGWTSCTATSIQPPHPSKRARFRDQFIKLHMLSYTQFERLLYLDGDTVVLSDIDDLFETPMGPSINLAATQDNFFGSWVTTFNCGVMLLRPERKRFDDMMGRLMRDEVSYDTMMSEQGFLNAYLRQNWTRLPMRHGANIVIFRELRSQWDAAGPKAVLHFTVEKPRHNQRCSPAFEPLCRQWREYDEQVGALSCETGGPCDTAPVATASAPVAERVPRQIWTFWSSNRDDPGIPPYIEACISLMRAASPGWTVTLITEANWTTLGLRVPSPYSTLRHDDVNIQRGFGISSQLFSDWIRLAVLARFGGVWLDATTLALRPPEAWVDMASEGLQGYSLPSYNQDGVMESFALAAPPHNALIALTKERFQEAISEGVKLWVDSKSEDVTGPDCSEASVKAARQASGDSSSPASVFCRSLKPMLPYLTVYAALVEARLARPTERVLLHSSEAPGGPMFYAARYPTTGFYHRFDEANATRDALRARSKDTVELRGVPFLKLRSGARKALAEDWGTQLTAYAQSGGLLAKLLTTPPQRMRLELIQSGLLPPQ